MSRDVTEDVGLPLSQAHQYLQQELGANAPSYVTLRRWAEGGRLASARVPNSGGIRPLYAPKRLLDIFTSWALEARQDQDTEPEDLKPFGRRMDQVEERLAELAAIQRQTQEMLNSVLVEVKRLDGIRTSLMLKYDAEHENDRRTIEELRDRLKQVAAPDSERALNKLQITLSQMRDTLNDMASRTGQ